MAMVRLHAAAGAVTPADTSYKRADWKITEPDGSPTTKATIDYDGVLTVNDEEGEVLVTATAADGHGATARKRLTIDLDPGPLRGNAARAPGVVATVSSESSADYAAAIDGITGQWAVGEWASELEVYAISSAPEAPREVKVDGHTVSWTAPAYGGGTPLTGYVVTPYRDGTALEPVVVEEEHTGVIVDAPADRFTVRARDLIGDGREALS